MRTDWKATALGGLLVAAALPAVVWLAEPLGGVLAFGLAATGLFLVVVVAERAVPADAAEALLRGPAEQAARLRQGLALQGPPTYVPATMHRPAAGDAVSLFLPAARDGGGRPVPILDSDTVLYPGSPGTQAGANLPIRPLFPLAGEGAAQPSATGRPAGAVQDLAEMETRLGGGLAAADLAHGLTLQASGDAVRAEFRAGACAMPCLASPERPDCVETGCAVCHTVGAGVALCVGRPVAAASADVQGRRVTLTFTPEAAAPAGTGGSWTSGAAPGDGARGPR